MKLLISIITLAVALTATAQLYPAPPQPGQPQPYPGNPGYPGYPPPAYGATCKIEFSNDYYYVSRNGARFTELTSYLQTALNQKAQLVKNGTCNNSYQDHGKCDIVFANDNYYVSRNGSRISALTSYIQTALNTRELLYKSQECNGQTYQPTMGCKIEFANGYYYVSRNGARYGSLTSYLATVTLQRDHLVNNYLCRAEYQYAPCRLEFSNDYFYISVNRSRVGELTSSLDTILNLQRNFSNQGMCSAPQATDRCEVAFSNGYYYVARNGARISPLTSYLNTVNNILYRLQSSRNCY